MSCLYSYLSNKRAGLADIFIYYKENNGYFFFYKTINPFTYYAELNLNIKFKLFKESLFVDFILRNHSLLNDFRNTLYRKP